MPVTVKSKERMVAVSQLVDKANGYVKPGPYPAKIVVGKQIYFVARGPSYTVIYLYIFSLFKFGSG